MTLSLKKIALIVIIVLACAAPKAQAACTSCTGSILNYLTNKVTEDGGFIEGIDEDEEEEFDKQEEWINETLWEGQILPGLRDLTDELSAVATYQAYIIGTFFDAKHQLETQQSLQTIRARAHKDYHPSVGMCKFGTISKSLSASERLGEFNALALGERSLDRHLATVGTAGATSGEDAKISRIETFKTEFCDPADNNGGLKLMCGSGAADKNQINKDIDFARTVGSQWTLDVTMDDGGTASTDEKAVLALAANLYGHEITRVSPSALGQNIVEGKLNKTQKDYLTLRSLIAKRSVAENSFNAIVGMKVSGLPGSREYLNAIMKELGVSDTATGGTGSLSDVEKMLGESPSYYAQMEVLTKKLYQNPTFYTNLYDKPANVARKEVALQAVALMQKFDLFKSYLRSEASLAVLLELAVEDLQGKITDTNNAGGG